MKGIIKQQQMKTHAKQGFGPLHRFPHRCFAWIRLILLILFVLITFASPWADLGFKGQPSDSVSFLRIAQHSQGILVDLCIFFRQGDFRWWDFRLRHFRWQDFLTRIKCKLKREQKCKQGNLRKVPLHTSHFCFRFRWRLKYKRACA